MPLQLIVDAGCPSPWTLSWTILWMNDVAQPAQFPENNQVFPVATQ
jgi:hypothetical protein